MFIRRYAQSFRKELISPRRNVRTVSYSWRGPNLRCETAPIDTAFNNSDSVLRHRPAKRRDRSSHEETRFNVTFLRATPNEIMLCDEHDRLASDNSANWDSARASLLKFLWCLSDSRAIFPGNAIFLTYSFPIFICFSDNKSIKIAVSREIKLSICNNSYEQVQILLNPEKFLLEMYK